MKNSLLLCAVVGMCAFVSTARAEIEKIAYPTAEKASFVLEVPSEWKMEQAEEEGDFFHLTAESGAVFSFRTIEGGEKELEEAIDRSLKQLSEDYSDVTLDEPQDWKPHGLTGFYATGTAKEKEDGSVVRVGLGWCALDDGKIAELWFVADADDKDGITAAENIANSLQAP